MARLAGYVRVENPDGQVVLLGPDSDIEPWAEEKITNPKAWDEEPERVAKTDENARVAETAPADERPPVAGKGSGVEAWRTYATAKGVEFDENDGRDEIVAKVDAAEKAAAEKGE